MKEIISKLISKKNIKKTITVVVLVLAFLLLFIFSFLKKEPITEDPKVPIGEHGKNTNKEEIPFDYKIDEKEKKLDIVSVELEYILKNRNSKLNTFGDMYIYDEFYVFPQRNIKIKKSFDNIISLVFMSEYSTNIFQGVNTKSTKTAILKALGQANYEKNNILIYKAKDFYTIIDTDIQEIAIYFIDELDIDLLLSYYTAYLHNKDLKTFINTLTSKFQTYYRFDYGASGLEIVYTNYGFKIQYEENGLNNGVYLYSDFKEDKEYIKDYHKNFKKEEQIKFIDTNLIFSEEILRKEKEQVKKNFKLSEKIYETNKIYKNINVLDSYNNEQIEIKKTGNKENSIKYKELKKLKNYSIYFETDNSRYTFSNVSIISKNSSKNYNINTAKVADYLLLTEDYVFYSIENEGIYRVDVKTGENISILYNSETFELKHLKNNYIYFDDKIIRAI